MECLLKIHKQSEKLHEEAIELRNKTRLLLNQALSQNEKLELILERVKNAEDK
jgi:hypothetical protein